MLVVRRSQLDALARARLAEKILHVASRRPALLAGHTREEAVAAVRAAVDRALDVHSFTTEVGVADYVGLALELGPDFDRAPCVARWLAGTGAPAELGLRRMFDALTAEEWSRLRAQRRSRPPGCSTEGGGGTS